MMNRILKTIVPFVMSQVHSLAGRRWHTAKLLGVLLFWTASSDAADVAATLSKPIVEPKQILHEIQEYCAARIQKMPTVKSVEEWESFAKSTREAALRDVVFRGQALEWRKASTQVEWLGELAGKGYRIRKLRFEAVPGMWIPGLLYEPENLAGPAPVVLNVNGHDAIGKAAPYKQIRCINQAKRGMIALNLEWAGMGQLTGPDFNHYKQNQIDLSGTSSVACMYLAMSRGLDILLDHKNADSKRVAVAGLSGGAWQTIFISSLDERVTLADPVAGYSSFFTRTYFHTDLGDSEQTPVDLAMTADYAVLTAGRAPKPILLTFNDRDGVFAAGHALPPLLEACRPIYRMYEASGNLSAHVNHVPGNHNFEQDNREALYRMFGRHFFGNPDDPGTEIPCDDEVLTPEQLLVELPTMNAGFQTIAAQLSRDLPRPLEGSAEESRLELSKILRLEQGAVTSAETLEKTDADGVNTRALRLRINDTWTLPAVEFIPEGATRSVIVISDMGRQSAVEQIQKLLSEKARVLTVDVYNCGEAKIPTHDFLFGLLVSSVGSRPLGVMTQQVQAVTEWWSKEVGGPVELMTTGKRTSLAGVCVAALTDEKSLTSLTTTGALTSLKDIISQGLAIPDGPELFCFGLLERFDVPQLKKLAVGAIYETDRK